MEKTKKISLLTDKRKYGFDPTKDLKRVEPSSVLLLSEVLSSGVVPSDTTDLDFNEIENPDDVAGRVTNVFDAIDLSKELAKSGASAKSEVKPSASIPTGTPSQEVKPNVSTPTAGID